MSTVYHGLDLGKQWRLRKAVEAEAGDTQSHDG